MSDTLSYACTAMQGWRTDMEDAHLTVLDVGGKLSGASLFSVCMFALLIHFHIV